MSKPEILTKAELAEELTISRPRVSQLVGLGMPVLPSGKVDLEAACRWIVDNLDPTNGNYGSPAWQQARDWVAIFDHEPVF
jgi:hypothetical protein